MQVFTTDEFAEWFAGTGDGIAEDVATMLEIIEQLGSERAAPGSRESLLWYEHPSVARFDNPRSIAFELEAWGSFRDYATQILKELEAPRFAAKITKLPVERANAVLGAIARIRHATDPRNRWALRVAGVEASKDIRIEEACSELRAHYFAALEAAGFRVKDVPAHSLALREVARRSPEASFRLLYGVHAEKDVALVVLGEWLDRSFYGSSVRRAEGLWKEFLDGTLQPAMRTP
jgi:hypothetical protein